MCMSGLEPFQSVITVLLQDGAGTLEAEETTLKHPVGLWATSLLMLECC